MNPTRPSLDQVRQVMRKIDRSLDDARDKRLNNKPAGPPAGAGPSGGQSAQPPAQPQQGRYGAPKLGKARPMLRRDAERTDNVRDGA